MTAAGWAATSGTRALVFVGELPAASGSRWIEGPDGHHLARVRRLGVDEPVVMADGSGRWVAGRIAEVGDGAVRITADGAVMCEPELAPHLTIAFAPAKRDHGTEVVHQLVELGVDRIVPLRTERGVVRWDGERGHKQLERLRRVAREASMQAQRARIPDVAAPASPADLAAMAAAGGEIGLVLADPGGVGIARTALPDRGAWVVVVGPEGGLAPGELDALGGCARVAVGPHVLRAVTAPVAVAACVAAMRWPRA